MYIFKESFLRSKDLMTGYTNVDLRNLLMANIIEDYLDGFITFTHTHLRGNFYLPIDILREAQVDMVTTMSLTEWLNYTQNTELPVTTVKPEYSSNVALYSDAIQANFDITRVGRYMALNANISDADKVDLHLNKNIPDKRHLYKRMLVTVNGFLHRTFTHENGVSVAGGGRTFNNTGINTAGILSFYKCCDLTQLPISVEMITPTTSTVPLYEELLINVNTPLEDKSVMISIGGYLFVNSQVCQIINAQTGILKVKLKRLDLLKMILNSVGIINLDSLGIFSSDKIRDYNKVRVSDILSDICIKKYMTLEQSFVIIADANCIQVDKYDLSVSGLPGIYESKTEPKYPIVNSRGVMSEYWKTRDDDTWVIRVRDDITKRYAYESNIDVDNEVISGMSLTYQWFHDDPKMMAIKIISKNK